MLAVSEFLGLEDGGMQGQEVRVPHLHLPGQGHLRHKGIEGTDADPVTHRDPVVETVEIPHSNVRGKPTPALDHIAVTHAQFFGLHLNRTVNDVRKFKAFDVTVQGLQNGFFDLRQEGSHQEGRAGWQIRCGADVASVCCGGGFGMWWAVVKIPGVAVFLRSVRMAQKLNQLGAKTPHPQDIDCFQNND